MGSFISKTTLSLLLQPAYVHIDKCDVNTRSWVRFANLKAKLFKAAEKNDIKQFPQKNINIKFDKILGLDFMIHEDSEDGNELITNLQTIIFSDAIKIINKETLSDAGYNFLKNNNVAMELIKVQFKNCLPSYKPKWQNWDSSSNTFELLAFNGLGQYYLKNIDENNLNLMPLNAEYQIDLSYWEKFEVRPNFEKYGGVAYFDKSLNCVGIVYMSKFYAKSDLLYNHVNFIFRSTLIMAITLREHLVAAHWVAGNSLLIPSMKYLSPTHIIRRFLRSFTFGTAAINHASEFALAPFEGIAGRTFGFTKENWEDMVTEQFKYVKYESIYNKFDNTMLPAEFSTLLPFYKDGMELWDINNQYVSGLINIYYVDELDVLRDKELIKYWIDLQEYFSNENYYIDIGELNKNNLINYLTYSTFMVTAGHSFLGGVCEYLLTPDCLMPKVLKDNSKYNNITSADVQTYIQALCIIAMTSSPMPELIGDWEYLFDCDELKADKQKYQAMINNLNQWQSNLKLQSNVVNSRNLTRPIEFNAFNPKILDCSVSI